MMMVEVKKEGGGLTKQEPPPSPSPSIKLGLGICSCNSAEKLADQTLTINKHGNSAFTPSQLLELQLHALIYKHFAAGIPVPPHLAMPIWSSVSTTFGSNSNGIGFGPRGFDYRSMMDSEPGRCRRTDGKKWRCSRKTVPDQKYCERHMHRGRQRSRKPVESSEINSSSSRPSPKLSNVDVADSLTSPPTTCGSNNQSKNHVKFAPPTVTRNHATASVVVKSSTNMRNKMVPVSEINTTATPITTIAAINTGTFTYDDRNFNTRKDAHDKSLGNSCSKNRNNMDVRNSMALGLGFSPKSVLQVVSCSSSFFESEKSVENEPGRCRRTDGKRWRCRRDVIPDHKYCGLHMHRGSKKQLTSSQREALLTVSTTAAIPRKPSSAIPNTNLSISTLADPHLECNEENSNASFSSETTISDTTILG